MRLKALHHARGFEKWRLGARLVRPARLLLVKGISNYYEVPRVMAGLQFV
jgi:hypothetical protein